MEPSWLAELIFESSHRTRGSRLVRTGKEVVGEFDDVLAGAFDDGVQPCVANAASSAYAEQSRPAISDEFSVAGLDDEVGRRLGPVGEADDFCDPFDSRRLPTIAPELRPREDEIYRFSSDFLHFAPAAALRKMRPLKAAGRTCLARRGR